MNNTVTSSQLSFSQGNFKHLLSSSVMHTELLFTMTQQTTIPIISHTCALLVHNLYEEHCPLKYFKLFFAIYRIKNALDFTIIIKNQNLLMDIGSIKFFHNGLIQQPWRLNLGSLHPVAATVSPFCYCTYLTCLILYSGRAQEHLSLLSDRSTFCSVIPHLLH